MIGIDDELAGKIVAEFSTEQGCFNITTLKEALKMNLKVSVRRKHNDYRIIGIFETREEASNFIESVKQEQSKYPVKQ